MSTMSVFCRLMGEFTPADYLALSPRTEIQGGVSVKYFKAFLYNRSSLMATGLEAKSFLEKTGKA